jgi:hypothetical protein
MLVMKIFTGAKSRFVDTNSTYYFKIYAKTADEFASRLQNVLHTWSVHYVAVNLVCVSVR